MTALPLIKSPRIQHNQELTTKLDSLLQECEDLIDIPKLHQEITQNLTSFNQELEVLKTDNKNSQETSGSPKQSRKVDDYLRHKFHSENLQGNQADQNRNYSFDRESFKGFSKQTKKDRRKFGESTIIFPQNRETSSKYGKLPEIQIKSFELTEKIRKDHGKSNRSGGLEKLIKEYMGKRFGIKYSLDQGLKKKSDQKIHKKKIEKIERPKLGLVALSNEIEYLQPEFKSYLNNTERKLNIEKIMIALHQKNRKKFQFTGK